MSPQPAQRRDLALAAGIFALALLARLLTLAEVRDIPSVEHLIVDAVAYDAWAQRIAGGEWLGSRVFYQAPAYPYLMALIYALPGPDVWMLRLTQALMGALSCVVAFATTRVLFGRGAAIAAGLILALYPPAIFFDLIVQKTSLGLLLSSSLLLVLVLFQRSRRPGLLLVAGAVLGLLVLTRENALIFVPAVGAWLPLRFRSEAPARLAAFLALFAAGLALPLGTVALRNHHVGDAWVLTTSQLGTNFYYGNHDGASGLYVPLLGGRQTPEFESPDARRLAEQALGRELSADEVSDWWLERGLRYVREQPVDWALLTLRKFAYTWNDYEIPDSEDLYVYADWSWVLKGGGWLLRFGVLAPLAAAGIVLAWRERRRFEDTWLLVALALVYSAGVALFLVLARFRFPLVPLLVPFAGFAVARLAAAIRARRFRPAPMGLGALLIIAVLCNLRLLDREFLGATSFVNFGSLELRDGDLEAAERYLLRAESVAPKSGDVQFHLAALRHEQGRPAEAEAHLRRMLRAHRGDYRGHLLMARVLEDQGRPEEARLHRNLARRLNPDRGKRQLDGGG